MQTLLGHHWHHLPCEEVLGLLESDLTGGLDRFSVETREAHFGPNVISEKRKQGPIDQAETRREADELAAKGLRVLALARRALAEDVRSIGHGDVAEGLVFLGLPIRTVDRPLLKSVDLGRDRRDDVAAACLHVCARDECAFPLGADWSRVLASDPWSGTRGLFGGRVREMACLSSGQPPRRSQVAERQGETRTRCPQTGEARLGEENDAG